MYIISIMKISKTQANKLAKDFNINLDVINIEDWYYGLNVELEHGKKLGAITNLTNDNLKMTAKIAIAHLIEFPDYYKRLQKMEKQAEKYWENKTKKSIFIE